MTDPKPTTNEEIALELGWTDIKDGMFADPVGTPPPGSDKTLFVTVALGGGRYYLPDFEHDWAHAGPLLEELPDEVVVKISMYDLEGEKKFLCKFIRGLGALSTGYGKTRKAALSRAWLAWKKEEKE